MTFIQNKFSTQLTTLFPEIRDVLEELLTLLIKVKLEFLLPYNKRMKTNGSTPMTGSRPDISIDLYLPD